MDVLFRVVADCHTKANYNDYFHDSERAGRVTSVE